MLIRQKLVDLYKTMFRIRIFEEKLLSLFSDGVLNGTTHTCIGQEANAVGVISNLNNEMDVVFSNHRGHGHYISFFQEEFGLLEEIMGLSNGVCSGFGGSQHLCRGNFYTNGIQGGIVPISVGIALSQKMSETKGITVVFIGDGTLGEGIVYESFNIASLLNVPILFVVENNRYAQSTPIALNLAGNIAERFQAFSIPTVELSTTNVVDIYQSARNIVERIRHGRTPFSLILNTYRFSPHSKGDDFRDTEEINNNKQHDPLHIFKKEYPELDYLIYEKEAAIHLETLVKNANKPLRCE